MRPGGGRDASPRQLAAIRYRWQLVLLLSVVAGGTATLLTLRRAPVYQATASVLLRPESAEQLLTGTAGGGVSVVGIGAASRIELTQSQVVRDAIRAKLGHEPTLTVEVLGVTDVLDIRVSSTDRYVAAAEATTVAEVYIDVRRRQRVEDLQRTGQLIRTQVAGLDRQLDELEKPLRALDAQLANTTDPRLRVQRQQQRDAAAAGIAAERDTLQGRRDSLNGGLPPIDLLAGMGTSGGVQLVSKAPVPTAPISPGPVRNGTLGLVGGLVIGIGMALLVDQTDDRLRRKGELEAAARLPVLGLLPLARPHAVGERLVTVLSPDAPTAEAYGTLRTSLQSLETSRTIRCLQVTSATKAEGKTTVVTHLAASFARAGRRVIVLDCDLRRSQVHERLGVGGALGFTSVLLGAGSLEDVLVTVQDEPLLTVVPAGPAPPNPSELLGSAQAAAIVAALRERCDILVVDSPPVLPVTDALVVSRHADATLLVARPNLSTKREVARACQLLGQVEAPLIGTVLNGVEEDIPSSRRVRARNRPAGGQPSGSAPRRGSASPRAGDAPSTEVELPGGVHIG